MYWAASPYYMRTELAFRVHSATKFDVMTVRHLGIDARSKGTRFDQGLYIAGDALEPETSALIEIKPFEICLANIGDSFLKVSIRMQSGIDRCRMIILQEGHQPKDPREVDTFIEYEGLWYVTATIGCLQTIRIEE